MKRILITIVLVLMTITTVSAAPIPLEGTCATATLANGDKVTDELKDHPTYNCFDIVCVAFVGDDTIIKVSDGTVPASEGQVLRGNASYLTTTETDLRDIGGYCDTPTFEERFCSVRADWNIAVGILRHYTFDSGSGEKNQWNHNLLENPPLDVDELENESVVLYVGGEEAFLCSDLLGPQLLFDERFDMRTGEREITLTFSDDEMNYSEMNRTDAGWRRTAKIALLLDREGDAADDQTTLSGRCEYAIKPVGVNPTSADWKGQTCSGKQSTIEIPAAELAGKYSEYVLHMRAQDSEGNPARETYRLTDYFEANGVDENGDPEGYCPRENECMAWPNGDLGTNGFARYISGEKKPACIAEGTAIDNVYCTDTGLITRSQALLSYGVEQLTSPGVVYCGKSSEVSRSSPTEDKQCGRDAESYNPLCTLSCVLSLDTGDDWQQSAAIFASNNFLSGDDLNMPEPFSRPIDDFEITDSRCDQSGTTSHRCMIDVEQSVGETSLEPDVRIVYDNKTGLGSISQTMRSLPFPSSNNVDGSLGDSLDLLTDALNTYLDDISTDAYEPPHYSSEEMRETLDISAYRTGTGKRIVGITTNIPSFGHSAKLRTSTAPTDMRVVAVLYEGFAPAERNYLDQAKNAISSIGSAHVRQNILVENVRGVQEEDYIILVTVNNIDYEDHAHELIEQLVVRPRI